MRNNSFRRRASGRSESGQVILLVLLALGIFLVGAIAFAVDLSNAWFNRQATQTAADSACTAGAMDLLVDATNGTTNQGGFSPAAGSFDCHSTPSPAPCQYAALNGFPSSVAQGSTAMGDNVSVSFPPTSSLPTVTFPSSTPGSTNPTVLMQVTITNNFPTFFAGMLKGLTKQSVGATALCGLVVARSPASSVALNPILPTSFSSTGTVNVIGGPLKSLQINSSDTAAVNIGGGSLNFCAGGVNFCGSNMGVWGLNPLPFAFLSTAGACSGNRPPGAPACTATQAAPQWLSPNAPVADPLASLIAPLPPSAVGARTSLGPGTPGCPDSGGCDEYSPGFYGTPTGICVGTGCGYSPSHATAIFDPGIYYVTGGIHTTGANPCLRPSDPGVAPGDGSGGTVFYFPGASSINIGGSCNTSNVTPFSSNLISCTGGPPPAYLPGSFDGSVLLAPCRPPTNTGLCAPNCSLPFRGILFFQNRGSAGSATATWSVGGNWLLGGTLYFHQCVSSGTDTSAGCTAYNDLVSLSGGGANSSVLGAVIADRMSLSGPLTMDLSSTAAYQTVKATLVQ